MGHLVGCGSKKHPRQTRYAGSRRYVDDRTLPADDFAKLNERFKFTIDVAAAPHNARLPKFCSVATSGLLVSWARERVYCNPPYSEIRPWILKAWNEYEAEIIVMLLPANRTEQGWWQDWVEPFRDRPASRLSVEFLPGRIRFLKPYQDRIGPNERPRFGCCLCIWKRIFTC